ncbi:MAG: hypothetical protein IJS40_05335 [Synergistaceae bacterium]|nr:hypothetical protein [Synergistaceae bacterium]
MKKFLLTLLFVMLLVSNSYAATSEDVYVRQDVFEIENKYIHSTLEKILTKLDEQEKTMTTLVNTVAVLSERVEGINISLSNRIDGVYEALSNRIEGVNGSLTNRINGINEALSAKINSIDKRTSDTHTFLYYLLVIFGAILLMPFVNKLWELSKEIKTPSVTLDDVRKLIEDSIEKNNAKLLSQLRA